MPPIDQIESLFHEALLLPTGVDREAWLVRRCGDREDLLSEVSSLLSAHDAMSAQVATDAETGISIAPPDTPVEQFGPYRLVRLLGQGGMSSVYLAERVDGQFDRQVAVKVMAAHLGGEEFVRRLRSEAQFLATLEHPNIPRLLDSGVSPSGHPYLVVEYVEGAPLDLYCDQRALGIEQRLRLFLQICQAVEHAHRSLILHRDLKPSNILVAAGNTVKLLDFGTAALMAAGNSVTVTRVRMLTPRYASPEQLRAERPGVTGDVFSLGVVLYELLTGAWPFGDPESVMSELRRAAGHATVSPPGSVITSEAATQRSLTKDRLKHALDGDLSAILLKALENEPAMRYATVGELAADIMRFLDGSPVEAHPQTWLYRSGKFVRRRWATVTAAAVFVIGLSGATLLALHQANVARTEAARAHEEAQKSDRVTQFLRRMLSSAYLVGGSNITVVQMLDAAEPNIEKSWKGDPLAEATLRVNLGSTYSTLGQAARGKDQLEKALTLFRSLGRHADIADTWFNLAIVAQGPEGAVVTAAEDYRHALEESRLAGADVSPASMFRLKVYLAGVLISAYQLMDAQALLTDALGQAERDPSLPLEYVVAAWTHQGELLLERGRFDEADAQFLRAIAGRRDKSDAWIGLARSNWLRQNFSASANFARQDYEVQAAQYNRDHLADAAEAEMAWARYRSEAGDAQPALQQVRAALPNLMGNYRAGFMRAFYLQDAARVFNKAGQYEDAEQSARESLKECRAGQLPDLHPLAAAATEDLGAALVGERRYRDAIAPLEHALAVNRQLGPAYAAIADRVNAMLREAKSRAL
ncbi:MAG TPA: serine/threonine-protein kinase [Bryobacteraceae bacterium]|nr:serine/threonine-protein kinase [Bryobacteraceae bacterium]